MEWIEVAVSVNREAVEAVSAILMDAGAAGVAIDDPRALLECSLQPGSWDYVELPENSDPNGEVIVKAWLQQSDWAAETVIQIQQAVRRLPEYGLEAGSCLVKSEIVLDNDWATAWKAYYKPLRVGKRLLIRPVWQAVEPTPGELEIALDPGLAFGTGTHPTTRLCLQLLEDYLQPGCSFLDVGCGSGILTIAAALLGAGSLIAVDLDEQAVTSTKDNLKLNQLSEKVTVIHGNLTDQVRQPVALITANIVANAIIAMLPDLQRVLLPGGVLLASGIITGRQEDVAAAIRASQLTLLEIRQEGEWIAMAARKER